MYCCIKFLSLGKSGIIPRHRYISSAVDFSFRELRTHVWKFAFWYWKIIFDLKRSWERFTFFAAHLVYFFHEVFFYPICEREMYGAYIYWNIRLYLFYFIVFFVIISWKMIYHPLPYSAERVVGFTFVSCIILFSVASGVGIRRGKRKKYIEVK